MARSVRATRRERARPLPGDDRLPDARAVFTHAVTIGRPPDAVWPWLAQMGGGRAGWYSYDRIDHAGQPSAQRLLPGLQEIRVGSVLPWVPGATAGFTVLDLSPGRHLVLADLRPDGAAPRLVWSFLLEPVPAGGTRLLVRARVGPAYRAPLGLPRWTVGTLVRWGHFVMQRRQLLGIAARAESAAVAG